MEAKSYEQMEAEFKEFYIEDSNGKSNCVIRSLCKILNKEYNEVLNGLITVQNQINAESFNDIPVFEKYMENNNIYKIDSFGEPKIKDLKLDNGSYIVFCYDKKERYHMVAIIDNVVYDKKDNYRDLYTISIYKEKKERK